MLNIRIIAIYIDNLETEFLPLNCNWITSNLLPKYDENNNTFAEPYLPNYKIGIIHLAAGIWKNGKDMRVDKSIEIEIETLTNKKLYIRYGGPVESGRGFVLHSDEVIQKETLSIDKGVALTSTSEFFEDLSKGKGPKNSILALGYAGWGPGQIEKEILSNSWMTLSAEPTFLFDDEVNNKWRKAYNLIGVTPWHKNLCLSISLSLPYHCLQL